MLIKSLPGCLVLLSCSTMSSTSYVPERPCHVNLDAPTHIPANTVQQNLSSKILRITSRVNRLSLPSIACLLTLLPPHPPAPAPTQFMQISMATRESLRPATAQRAKTQPIVTPGRHLLVIKGITGHNKLMGVGGGMEQPTSQNQTII